MSYANNKGADQPAHPRSLISAFVVRCLDSIISVVSIAEISRLVCVWPGRKLPKTRFVMSWLKCLRTLPNGKKNLSRVLASVRRGTDVY